MINRVRTAVSAVALAGALAIGCSSPDPAKLKAEAIRHGDEFIAQHKPYLAAAQYREAVRLDGRDADARLKLARVLEDLHKGPEAGRQFIEVADLRPDDQEVQIKAITWLVALGRCDEAVDRASRMLQHDQDNPRLLVLFGNAKAKLKGPTHAIDTLDAAWRKGQPGARDHIRSATLRADDQIAEDVLRRALTLAPDLLDAQTSLIGFLWTTGRMDEGAAMLEKAADAHPELPYLRRGLGLYDATIGHDAQAEAYLKQAAGGGDRDSAFALADYYVLRKRFADAATVIEPLAAGGDGWDAAAMQLAEIDLDLGRCDDAMKQAERVLAKNPKNGPALLLKARLLVLAGSGPQALEVARAAINEGQNTGEAQATLARALVMTGDLEGGFHAYANSWRAEATDAALANEIALLALKIKRDEVAVEFAGQSVRLDPASQDAALTLARAQVRVHDFATAEKTLAPLLARRGGTADVLVLVGAIQASRGNVEGSRSSYLRALDADRNSIAALSALVELEINNHQAARVRPQVDKAVALNPGEPSYLVLASRVAFALSEMPRAESLLKTALNVDPGNVEAALFMADVLSRQGRRPDAQQVVEQVLQKQPESLTLNVRLALLLEEMGQTDAARARYERMIQENPQAASVVSVRLAALYANTGGNLDVALGWASAAKRNLPNDPLPADTLGWIYVKKGLTSRGMPYLLEAIQGDPSNALYHYHLGVAHESVGDFAKAAAEQRRALDLNPNFPAADDAKTRLNHLPGK